MNKTTKGTIAIAAAAALLVGGAGSLAYWQESANVASANIATGQLHVTTQTGAWAVKKQGASTFAPIANIATFKMVPGDVVTYTVPFTTTAEGDNLAANATVAWGAASSLPTGVTSATSGTYNGTAFTGTSFAVVKQATPVSGQLVFTLTWDFGTTGNTNGMSQTINLAATTVTVAQVVAP